MDTYCPRTGDPICKCKKADGKIIIDFDAFKTAMRRIFTDHAVYTSKLIEKSVPTLLPDANDTAARLLENPLHIRTVLEPILGPVVGEQLQNLFTEHLKLAAATLEPARTEKSREVKIGVEKLLEQGKQVGMLLGSIDPTKLSPELAIREFNTHNNYVVSLVTLRTQRGKDKEYINLYDDYFNHMMALSDSVTSVLPRKC